MATTYTWELDGTLNTYASTNPKQALSSSPLESEATFTKKVSAQGVLPAGSGWVDISLDEIATAALLDFRIETATDVRLNGTDVIANCSRLLIQGDITQLEIAQISDETPTYWATFIA